MLDDPIKRAAFAKENVRKSLPPRRPKNHAGRGHDDLNSHEENMLLWDSVNINVPLRDETVTREILVYIRDHLPSLIASMDRESTKISKQLRVRYVLHHWSRHVFKGWGRE